MISATVISASESYQGCPIVTLELVYPRFIHSEFMTHRMFSRNSASSRAIPVQKNIEKVLNDPVFPIHWGKNKPGMQATEEVENTEAAKEMWKEASINAAMAASRMSQFGVHKQIVNRLLEPFSWMTTLVTATEWENFLALRDHQDAQPEIQELAKAIKKALTDSKSGSKFDTRLHAPYSEDLINTKYDFETVNFFGFVMPKRALVSVGRCCRVSYLTHDGKKDPDKDISLAIKLLKDGHMSPFEHVAVPNMGRSANFSGWRSIRKFIPWEADFSVFLSGNYDFHEELKRLGEL